jgi:multicomponent Na+:H+ antiporter subunit D
MTSHVPALQVVVPLFSAPLCLLIRKPSLTRVFAVGVTWACLVASVWLLHAVRGGAVIEYAFGSWPAPWGIVYSVDSVNAYVLLIVSAIASVVLPVGPGAAAHSIPEGREHLFYAAFLACLAGLLGVTITGDAFNVFVFLEISSLSSYTLIGLGKGRRALTAAYSYLVVGTIGATFILIGIGLMYQMTGTLNMADLAARLPAVKGTRTILAAFAFFSVGISIKLAVFPMHQWLPNAYAYAPAVVSAFLASTATKVFYYVLLRIIFTIFGVGYVFQELRLDFLLLPLALGAIFVGSIAAIFQRDLRRLLAYSSVAQIGYMILGLTFVNLSGLTGGIVHLFNHALMKGGLFLVAACVFNRIGSTAIDDLRGLGKQMPLTMAAFVVGGLAMIGVPGTAGFVSKWYLVLGAIDKGWYGIAFLVVLSSLLSVVYVWRVIEVAYFSEAPEPAPRRDAPLRMLIPTWILVGGTVYFGLFTDLSVGVAHQVAGQLLGVAP